MKMQHLPTGWAFKKLGELGSIIGGLTYSPDDVNNETGTLVLRSSNVQERQIVLDDNVFVKVDESGFNQVKEDDILICVRNGSKSLIGKSALIPKDIEGAAFGAFMSIYRSDINRFLFQIFDTDIYYKQIHQNLGATINSINGSDLKLFSIPFPPLPEQQKIAQVLSTWDEAIQTTQSLIKKLETRKNGLMQRLLSGKTRLKGFEKSKWQVRELSELITPIIREVPKPNKAFLGLGLRSHGKGTFLKHDFDPKKIEMENLYQVRENDLIVNITFAWEGAIAIASLKDDKALVSHRFPTYTFNNTESSREYFRHFLNYPRFRFSLILISPGGAGRNRVMSKKDFLSLAFKFPPIEEQIAIAKILNTADAEINETKAYLAALKQQKKGLMQQLLTGKIRVKTDG